MTRYALPTNVLDAMKQDGVILPSAAAVVEAQPGLVEVEATREMVFWCCLQAEMAGADPEAGALVTLAQALEERLSTDGAGSYSR